MGRWLRRGAFVVALCLLGVLLFSPGSTALAYEPEAYAGASLSGVVWQDYCASNCTAGSSLRRGNGQPDEAEVRLAGVRVGLGAGLCRFSHPTRFTTTDSQGRYSFSGLTAGTYCVTVNSRQSATAFPKPGVWTRPSGRSPWYVASYTVFLGPASVRGGLNFGWDTTTP